MLDSSNYPSSHQRYSLKNKARLGCFKDECAGKSLKAWYFLRPKCYELVYEDENRVAKAKGVNSRNIDGEKYEKLARMELRESVFVQETRIRSKDHVINTVDVRKRALTAYEDKRLWLGPNESVPYN